MKTAFFNTMLLERLINRLKLDEGFRAEPYQDTVNVWTIGYGTTHILGQPVTSKTKPVTKKGATRLLYLNLADSVDIAKNFVNNFSKLSYEKQEALVNMAYQLGNRLNQFKKAREAIQNSQWDRAYRELLNSKWAKQTPKRAKRVSEVFLT
jgi:lysozyme